MKDFVILSSSSPPQSSDVSINGSKVPKLVPGPPFRSHALYDIGSSDFEGDIVPKLALIKKPKRILRQSPTPIDVDVHVDEFRDSRLFDDSVLDNFGEHDFVIEQPRKRRRITPSLDSLRAQSPKRILGEDVFELSSEPGHDSVRPRSFSKDGFSMLPGDEQLDIPPFSSSAPVLKASTFPVLEHNIVIDLSSDNDYIDTDPVISSSQPARNARSLSEGTASVLADFRQSDRQMGVANSASVRQIAPFAKSTKSLQSSRPEFDDKIIDSSQSAANMTGPAKATTARAARKTTSTSNKQNAKEQKQVEKEAAREQKRLEKEKKAAEKQLAADRAEVNRKKTDKKKTSEEMIVELPYSIKGKSLGNQLEILMKEVDIEVRYYQHDVDMTNENPTAVITGTVVKWYRKVNSKYNHEAEEYESCPPKIEREKHILIHLSAEEFCGLAVAGPTGEISATGSENPPSENKMISNMDAYITILRSQHPSTTIVVLIQGLPAYLKKSVNTKNREYASAVRALNPTAPDSQLPPKTGEASTRPSKKRKSNNHPQVDLSFLTQTHIDPLTLHLQLNHQPLHIHHTSSINTSARQILAFTQHLSTRPYRITEQSHNLAHASFCMASGQFRTGQGDATETWLKMLEQVNRITASMALGIVKEGYENPRELVEAFQKTERVATNKSGGHSGVGIGSESTREAREAKEKAKLMLQDVMKGVNRNGERSDRRLGPAASKRIYRVFTSKDENLRDGIV